MSDTGITETPVNQHPPIVQAGHGHDPHLAHHFHSPQQQYESGKLGMWIFLATEVLMFGGLFCAYAVYRANHPEIFLYAHQFLDKTLGGINTLVLICSSLTMAWGVRAAQLNQKKLLPVMLVLTLLGAVGFLGIKYVEYKAKWEHGLLWGKYYDPQEHVPAAEGKLTPGDTSEVEKPAGVLYEEIPGPTGTPQEGTPAEPVEPQYQDEPGMPADTQVPGAAAGEAGGPADATPGGDAAEAPTATGAGEAGAAAEAGAAEPADPDVPRLTASAIGPTGLDIEPATLSPLHHSEPENVRTFFSVYFLMTGLHGIHVLVGMGLIAWILVRSLKHEFSNAYFIPVDCVGLYWHLVDLIWIFLFPLLYLIH